eukprot:CAMPEP_0170777896 /NCGR_PEP_ID=MMETSP0733-20121128/12063_1 /TAXON_ID=186038 /ORGANISM="Fragilariopsis kerguelensis, Strain L26-C5" /LENGTH=340 /DNA_ID=CAMNT_0011121205 /DNA_START=55 /DNA_END=1077 /DNA_ORIENTATION=-
MMVHSLLITGQRPQRRYSFLYPSFSSSSTVYSVGDSKSKNNRIALSMSPSSSDSTASTQSDEMELLKDIPFVPEEVISKFLSSIGGPLAAGNLQAGYQAGIVSSEELQEIQTKLPDMASDNTNNELQSIDYIQQKWNDALVGQPWHIQKLGALASSTVVGVAAKLQQKSFAQANAMKYINENALPIIEMNTTMIELLSSSSNDDDDTAVVKLRFNNTRAKYEPDRKVWSASMDVFDERMTTTDIDIAAISDDDDDTIATAITSDNAVAALMKGMDDEGDDELKGRIGVSTAAASTKLNNNNNNNNKIGLVNAYFIPDDEIKILVVEIDDVMHNLTWKGLP